MKMISTGPPMPVPNHSAAKGTQAIGATKRMPSNSGATMRSTQRNQAIARPSGMPTTTAEHEAHREALEARQQVRLQREAGKRLADQLDEARDDVPRRRQEVARASAPTARRRSRTAGSWPPRPRSAAQKRASVEFCVAVHQRFPSTAWRAFRPRPSAERHEPAAQRDAHHADEDHSPGRCPARPGSGSARGRPSRRPVRRPPAWSTKPAATGAGP